MKTVHPVNNVQTGKNVKKVKIVNTANVLKPTTAPAVYVIQEASVSATHIEWQV